jgi:RNA polymerase subunit RPABC4/transcription elongation factor Spt4
MGIVGLLLLIIGFAGATFYQGAYDEKMRDVNSVYKNYSYYDQLLIHIPPADIKELSIDLTKGVGKELSGWFQGINVSKTTPMHVYIKFYPSDTTKDCGYIGYVSADNAVYHGGRIYASIPSSDTSAILYFDNQQTLSTSYDVKVSVERYVSWDDIEKARSEYRYLQGYSNNFGFVCLSGLFISVITLIGTSIYLIIGKKTPMPTRPQMPSPVAPAPAQNKCPQCGSDVQPFWKVCPVCESKLPLLCRHCGATVQEGWKACPNCGEKL